MDQTQIFPYENQFIIYSLQKIEGQFQLNKNRIE